jgi:hypothetical protein
MKNLNQTVPTALTLAASISLALLALPTTADAQSPFTETVQLSSGTDGSGLALSVGSDDDITQVASLVGMPDYIAAQGSTDKAKVIESHSAWVPGLLFDLEARWIHSSHDSTEQDGTGVPAESVLYAQGFELPLHMPGDATVTVQMEFAADDMLGAVGFNGNTIPAFSSGTLAYKNVDNRSITATADDLGLVKGHNDLFVWQIDTGGAYSGIIYSVTIKVEYCIIEAELRSGMRYQPVTGDWWPMATNSTQPNVRTHTLPEVYTPADLATAFSDLRNGGGLTAKTVNKISTWTLLSQPAQWINSVIPVYETNHNRSALYAIDFQLPLTLPGSLIATLDLEWAADDKLGRVEMNSNQLSLSGMNGPNNYSLPTTKSFTGTVSALGLQPGSNTLFLLQDDVSNSITGIIYTLKLEIEYPCSGYEDTDFVTFCDCIGEVAPCQNPGTPGTGCANTTGLGAILSASGLAQVGSSSFELHASNLPPGATGIFLRGKTPINSTPFGQGLLCIGKTSRLKLVKEDGTGQADSGILVGPLSPGTLQYQFLYRDQSQNGCKPWNLTNAIAVTWN